MPCWCMRSSYGVKVCQYLTDSLTWLLSLVHSGKTERLKVKPLVCVCACTSVWGRWLWMHVLTISPLLSQVKFTWENVTQEPCAGMCKVRVYLSDTHKQKTNVFLFTNSLMPPTLQGPRRSNTSGLPYHRKPAHIRAHSHQTSPLEVLDS